MLEVVVVRGVITHALESQKKDKPVIIFPQIERGGTYRAFPAHAAKSPFALDAGQWSLYKAALF